MNCQSSLNLYDNSQVLVVLCLNEKDPLIALPPLLPGLETLELHAKATVTQCRTTSPLPFVFSPLPSFLSLLNLPPDNSHLSSSELQLIFGSIIDFGFLAHRAELLCYLQCNSAVHFYTALELPFNRLLLEISDKAA